MTSSTLCYFTDEQLIYEAESFAKEFYTHYAVQFQGKCFNKDKGTTQHTKSPHGISSFSYNTYLIKAMDLEKHYLSVVMIYRNEKISKKIIIETDMDQLTKFNLPSSNWNECYLKAYQFAGRFFKNRYSPMKKPLIKIEIDKNFNVYKVFASFDLCTEYTLSCGDFILYSKPTIDYLSEHDSTSVNLQEFYEFIFLQSYLNIDSLFNVQDLSDMEKFLYYVDNKEQYYSLIEMVDI